MTAGFHYSSWIVCRQCYRFTKKDHFHGVVINELEFQSNDSNLFPGWGEYDLLFDLDIVNLRLKNNGGETEDLMLLFL